MLVIVALRKLRQGDHRFEDNLDSEKKKESKYTGHKLQAGVSRKSKHRHAPSPLT